MNKFKDGWEIIPKESVSKDIKEVISKGKEQDRVVDIMEDLLMDCHTELSWFFSENADSIEDQEMLLTMMKVQIETWWKNNFLIIGKLCMTLPGLIINQTVVIILLI